jgi:Pyridine nucleotide-disulphide oxidoreductase
MLVLILFCFSVFSCIWSKANTYHRYIIVGAGPGGLQLAHFFESNNYDYLVLEKESFSGSFFQRFPRWRQLISINKRYVGTNILDYAMRHDWNSLLSESYERENVNVVPCVSLNGSLVPSSSATCFASAASTSSVSDTIESIPVGNRFTDYSDDYYPNASLLVDYLNHMSGEIQYRSESGEKIRPKLRIKYEQSVKSVRSFEGNSKKSDAAKFSQSTPRFVLTLANGEEISCSYLIWAAGFQRLNVADGVNIATDALNYWTHSTDINIYRNKSVLILGRGNAAFEIANHVLGVTHLVHLVGRDTGRIKLALETHYPGDVRRIHSNLLETYLLKSMDGLAEMNMKKLVITFNNATKKYFVSSGSNPCSLDKYGRANKFCFFRREYDFVISCPGWRMDTSVFEESVRPKLFMNKKHPDITPAFESVNVPGLFFVGTLAHAKDFKKASGGFIHGFRYTARALFRHFEEVEVAAHLQNLQKNEHTQLISHQPWPRRYSQGLRSLMSMVLERINNAAGIYQMFGALVDVIVLPPFSENAAVGFTNIGVSAALENPCSYFDAGVTDPLLIQVPPTEEYETSQRRKNEKIVDQSLLGAYFEEVPVELVQHKVPSWALQTAAVFNRSSPLTEKLQPNLGFDSSVGGFEYVTLSLEFGKPKTGSSSEWPYGDPFSPSRAADIRYPEGSHFLHPVLRYFHTSLNKTHPTIECHIIEDFHIKWDQHSSHILPLSRCLEDIGARRAQAAQRMGVILHSSKYRDHADSLAPKMLRALYHPIIPKNESGFKFADTLDALVRMHGSTMFWWGEEVSPYANRGFHNYLTINASFYLLRRGPTKMLIFWSDYFSKVPLSQEEKEFTKLIERSWTDPNSDDYDADFAHSAMLNTPSPPVSSHEIQNAQKSREKFKDLFKRVTETHRRLLIVEVPSRVGTGALKAPLFQVKKLPSVMVFDQSLGVTFLGATEEEIVDSLSSETM